MTAVFGAAVGDVLWALAFLVRHGFLVLVVSAIPAAQRVMAALHPDDPRLYAWPVEVFIVLAALNALAGHVLEAVVRHWSDDARIANAWISGVRNLLIIPIWYAVAYGLVRPAFLQT